MATLFLLSIRCRFSYFRCSYVQIIPLTETQRQRIVRKIWIIYFLLSFEQWALSPETIDPTRQQPNHSSMCCLEWARDCMQNKKMPRWFISFHFIAPALFEMKLRHKFHSSESTIEIFFCFISKLIFTSSSTPAIWMNWWNETHREKERQREKKTCGKQ